MRTVLILGLLFCGYLVSAQDSEKAAAIKSALRSQDFERAVALAREAVAQSPNRPQLWMLEGMAYAGEGDKAESLAAFHKALAVAPDYLPALHQEAQLEFESGNMAAIPVLHHILQLQPGDPTAHAMIAVLEYRNGNCAAAVSHFARTGELLDSQIDGLHAYATCLVRLKQFDAAARVFQRALTLQPENAQERRVLASIQLMAHDAQGALATLAPLLDSKPDASTLELAASACEDQHDTDRAVSSLRQAILLAPKEVSLYLEFAQISLQHSSYQVGVDVLNDGIGEVPDSAQLYFARGVLYVNLAQYEKAQADFQRAYELDPNQSLTTAAQGLLAVQQNDLDRALTDVRQKLSKKPDDPVLLYLEADVLAQKGVEAGTPEFRTALHSAERAVALRPGLAPAREVLAKLYLDGGQNQQAAEQCRKALEIDPKNQTSVYRLIQALRKTGHTQEIPELLKTLAQLRQDATKEERQRNRYKLVEREGQ